MSLGAIEGNLELGAKKDRRYGIKSPGQHGSESNTKGAEALLKITSKEDSYEKARLMEVLEQIGNSLGRIKDPTRYQVDISSLVENIQNYEFGLGSKTIIHQSSVEDFLGNINAQFGSIGGNHEADFKEDIEKALQALSEYINLMTTYREFESSELEKRGGFLFERINPEEYQKIKSNRLKYVQRSKEILEMLYGREN